MDVKVTKTETSSPSDQPDRVDPRQVTCPVCNANVGEKCKTGPKQWVEWFHLQRVYAALPQASQTTETPEKASPGIVPQEVVQATDQPETLPDEKVNKDAAHEGSY
jgi:hypothetical protein